MSQLIADCVLTPSTKCTFTAPFNHTKSNLFTLKNNSYHCAAQYECTIVGDQHLRVLTDTGAMIDRYNIEPKLGIIPPGQEIIITFTLNPLYLHMNPNPSFLHPGHMFMVKWVGVQNGMPFNPAAWSGSGTISKKPIPIEYNV